MTSDLEMQKKVMGDPLIWKQGVRIKWVKLHESIVLHLLDWLQIQAFDWKIYNFENQCNSE